MSTAELSNLVSRLEAVVLRLESKSGGGGDASAPVQFIEDWDNFVSDNVEPYVKASAAIGGLVEEQAKLLRSLCDQMKSFLLIVAKHSAPSDSSVVAKLVAGLSEGFGKMDAFNSKLDRKSNLNHHVKAASEGVLMFAWITIPKTPMKHVQNTKDTVMFYTNKVLTGFKTSGDSEKHKTWVASYLKIFNELVAYIKEYHTTGPSWNPKGSPATAESTAQSSGPPAPPPAPAAPPPPPAGSSAPKPTGPSASAVSALMSDLNKGSDVTKGLKKVTNDMKTHKNPELRKHHVPVPYKQSTTTYKPINRNATQAPSKPPKLELQNKKWVVEYHEKANLELKECKMNHTIYIYRCNNTTIAITGKVNSVVLDSCKKAGLVFDSVVSGIEVVNCQSVQVQAQHQMPIVSIDKTDGCIVYLSKECLEAEIVTAKSSEMNISIPKPDGDFVEYPIVEQFRTTWDSTKKTFVTVPAEQVG